MAHGIRHGTSSLVPKIWGKELEKDGVAWMAAKWNIPALSLGISESSHPSFVLCSRI
jgi:hypothetical protein